MMKTSEDKSITTRILRSLYNEISTIIKKSPRYLNEADFIRVAVSDLIDKEKKKK